MILPGFISVAGIEQPLDLPERLVQLRAEEARQELAADQAVAVLAGKRAAVVADQLEGLVGDRDHLLPVFRPVQIEHRPEMDHAHAGVGIHGRPHVATRGRRPAAAGCTPPAPRPARRHLR